MLTGHDEVVYRPRVVNGTIISETRARAEFLSEINLTVEDGDVVAANGRLINTTDAPKNETASRIINEYRSEVDLDSTIAYSETALDARFATNYHRESNYGDLVTDAMRAKTGADVAITNAGGIRSDGVYGPGNITGGDVFNTLPFGNEVVTVELTGRELEATLASQVTTLESEAGQQYGAEMSMQVSGVRFEWVGHEGRDRIRDVSVNGEPLDPNATYEVAVNDFMAGGGSGYPLADKPVVQRTDELISTTVVDYLKEKGRIAPTTEGRIQRVDTPSTTPRSASTNTERSSCTSMHPRITTEPSRTRSSSRRRITAPSRRRRSRTTPTREPSQSASTTPNSRRSSDASGRRTSTSTGATVPRSTNKSTSTTRG